MLIVAVAVLFGAAIAFRYPWRYRAEIAAACEEFGVSERLACAVVWTESKFRPQATSSKGARGLMQIMPSTGAYLAELMHIDFDADRLYEPRYNVRMGVFYLSRLLERYERTYALAAYNAGESHAAVWAKTGEIAFQETRDYVERIDWAEKAYRFRGVSSAAQVSSAYVSSVRLHSVNSSSLRNWGASTRTSDPKDNSFLKSAPLE